MKQGSNIIRTKKLCKENTTKTTWNKSFGNKQI